MVEQIVDFGHAPIFADADTFPCIIVLRKPEAEQPDDAADQTEICLFPREIWGQVELPTYVRQHSYHVPAKRFSAQPWSLERGDVDELMEKLRHTGIPLTEFMKATPYRGILTGLNQVFLIDTPTRERLIQADPNCAAVIQPYLRGQDIKRWTPEWAGLWMILLKSSDNYPWPWAGSGDQAEPVFAQTFPALYQHFKPLENELRKRQDQGRYWWELRSCAYYEVFEQPKIIHTDIAWRPQFAFTNKAVYLLNTAYVWPTTDLYLLAVVNSPLIWAYMWRNAMHGKDEALRLIYSFTETLPIAPPTEAIRAEAEPAVERLIALTQEQRQNVRDVLDWLKLQFGIDKPGQQITAFASLSEENFLKEIERRRPRSAGRLTPADMRVLRDTYQKYTPLLRQLQGEMKQLEQRLATLVTTAYHLTPAEIDLLWRTAPPRTPVGPPGDQP